MSISSPTCRSTSSNAYKTEQEYVQNRLSQIAMTPQTMEQLRNYKVIDTSMLKLEYFFYTNSEEKAVVLSGELEKLGYESAFSLSAGNATEYVINGWTTKMAMDDKTVEEWTALMCDLGRDNDCEFDGWGTNRDQEN